jgi:hypothetical protein
MSEYVFGFSVLAIINIGVLITAGVLTGKRLLRFVGRLLLLIAMAFAAYWVLKLLLIPGAIRIFDSLKQMAAGLAYLVLAIILLLVIARITIFAFKKHSQTMRHREKKKI